MIADDVKNLMKRAREINRELRTVKDLDSYRQLLQERETVKHALAEKRNEIVRDRPWSR